MFLLVTDVIWELAEKNHERQVKIIAPYAIIKIAMRMIMMTVTIMMKTKRDLEISLFSPFVSQ